MKQLLKLSAASLLVVGALSVQASTLGDVQAKGYVSCGVSKGLAGFSSADSSGTWTGVDVDVCRAVAAATLGDAQKVKFVPLTAKKDLQRFNLVKLICCLETLLGQLLVTPL